MIFDGTDALREPIDFLGVADHAGHRAFDEGAPLADVGDLGLEVPELPLDGVEATVDGSEPIINAVEVFINGVEPLAEGGDHNRSE